MLLQGAAAARRRGAEPVAHRVARRRARRVWDYVFFIDVDGHAGEPAVASALDALESSCELVKVLGSYPRAGTPEEREVGQRQDELVEPAIAKIAPYEPGKPIEELERELGVVGPGGAIKLASNENPSGRRRAASRRRRRRWRRRTCIPTAALLPARQAGGAPRRRRQADLRRRRLERDHRSAGADVLRRGRRGAGAAVFVRLLPAGGRGAPAARSARRRAGADARLRRRRAARRGRAAHQARVPRQPQQPDRRATAAARRSSGSSRELPPSDVLLVVDEAYFEYARAADYPDARELPRASAQRMVDAAHVLEDLRAGRAARRLRRRRRRSSSSTSTACACRSTSAAWRRRRRWRRSTTTAHVERSRARQRARGCAARRRRSPALGLERAPVAGQLHPRRRRRARRAAAVRGAPAQGRDRAADGRLRPAAPPAHHRRDRAGERSACVAALRGGLVSLTRARRCVGTGRSAAR